MLKHFKGARLGLFIFLGTILLVLSIFLIGNKESLFVTSIHIKAFFTDVQGLKTGAPVRLSGYDIGSVSNISMAEDTTGLVVVDMRIDEELKDFVRIDSKASIETEGLVGKKIIIITPGSPQFEVVSNGSIIESKTPISITEIIIETQEIMSYMKEITRDFAEIADKINRGEGTVGKLLTDDELYTSTVDITKSADESLNEMTAKLTEITDFVLGFSGSVENIFNNLDSTVTDIRSLLDNVEKGEGVLGALIADRSAYDSIKTVINNLVFTTESAVAGAEKFAENMEALKHNWLFKGYFEERGYWDRIEYENEIDRKLNEIKTQNSLLDEKLKELRELESRLDNARQNE
ncbi:MAG: MlaD family protein [Melioribacteraceae bacterium]|nr:MlaD family protein [Melioribacteraceae bacterium]MCF8355050.1 MlaD family protein [Melioribacteraceae bacterium]MCF8395653.1 MlaD family protein [Melioribacteraceae bacterium]MCF8420268.1 MlaD family protein [Melioribacteraceae bacterium]